VWRTKQAPDMTWYPVIETVTDSLGNVIAEGNHVTGSRLTVGDILTFRCVATDPQDRPLTWTLYRQAFEGPVIDEQVGREVTLTWLVGDQSVAEKSIVVITMKSGGTYHRIQIGVDAMSSIFYTVDPPALAPNLRS
jgi:hypothetical protein